MVLQASGLERAWMSHAWYTRPRATKTSYETDQAGFDHILSHL